jgi:hypothetical protein
MGVALARDCTVDAQDGGTIVSKEDSGEWS